MTRTYAQIRDLCEQMLQDPDGAIYDTTETDYWIEESLKELAGYDPHIVDVIFKIESRTGSDTAGTEDELTDTTESQFVDSDATSEKVVHNTTDHTWAVVTGQDSTSVLTLSADIMNSGEDYRIYNKRCLNSRQIYIGDVTDYLWIDSVEYPIGQKRNWKVYGDVLEIDVWNVADSDTTQTDLPNVDVLVRFAKPHRLCQLTDLGGTCADGEPVGETTVAVNSFGTTETIEIGDELHIADHRSLYTVTTGDVLSGGTGSISVYPGMEAATTATDVVTFTKSTLKPHLEELFCHLVAARAVLSDSINYINAINKGGVDVWRKFQEWGERKLGEVLSKLERIAPIKTKRVHPRW